MLADVLGNERALSFLQKVKTSPPSVFIFHGPEGVGKKVAAIEFACELFCTNHTSDCVTCRRIHQRLFSDLVVFQSAEATIKVDEMRELVKDTAPIESPYKFVIIDECEKVTGEAASCLLKVLEEPSPKVIYVLVTSKYQRILATIRSRAVSVEFFPLSRAVVKQFLIDNKAAETNAEVVSRMAAGSISKALQYYSGGKLMIREQILKMFSFMSSPSMLIGQLNAIKDIESFFEVFKDLICDLYLLNYDQNIEINNLDIRDQLLRFSSKDFVPKLYQTVKHLNSKKEQVRSSLMYHVKVGLLSSLFA